MKEFKHIESAKYIKEGFNKMEEVVAVSKELENNLKKMEEIYEFTSTYETPNVDILTKIVSTEVVDQYVCNEVVGEISNFKTLENYIRESTTEVEVKREGSMLVYTLIENNIKAVAKENYLAYGYEVALEIARAKAKIEIQKKKIEMILDQRTPFLTTIEDK